MYSTSRVLIYFRGTDSTTSDPLYSYCWVYISRDYWHLDLLQNISEKIIDKSLFFHTIRPLIVEQKLDVSIP